jgi:tetratricopeptide (TPR) repeat protein
MASDNGQGSETGGAASGRSETAFAQIKPVAVELTAKSPAEKPSKPNGPLPKRHLLRWGALLVLLASAVTVIFVLPNWVSVPVITIADPNAVANAVTTANSSARPPATASTPSGPAITPWERAQQSKVRKDTQEILAQMLEAQETLVEHGVTVWAEEPYNKAMLAAQNGDQLYNRQQFKNAHTEYSSALKVFNELTEQVDVVFEETIERGNKALSDGDSASAHVAFDLALAIDVTDRLALKGKARASSLDEVLVLIAQGDEQVELAQFEEQIRERDFNLQMSAGFNALHAGQYSQARKSFAAALRIKPNSVDARSALNQTDQDLTKIRINSLLREAQSLEREERWHDALARYGAALKKDGALADAQSGKKRTALRAQIDDRFTQILAKPKRLYDADVYRETANFHRMVSATANPGPKLSKQISQLKNLLTAAETPIRVRLRSDNLTKVVMYKMGDLGFFTDKEINVRPGRYVALGYREGYGDVRVEFLVEPGKPGQVVTVQAQTKVASGGGA